MNNAAKASGVEERFVCFEFFGEFVVRQLVLGLKFKLEFGK